jgi:inhibitor of cysteine peptidase
MKKGIIMFLTAVLLTATFLTGCGGTKSPVYTQASQTTTTNQNPGPTATAVHTDASQLINVKANQEFTIALEANPTTGYDWQPVFDSGVLSQVKKDYQQDDHSGKPLVGSGGTDFFTYKALKTGETKITFTYYRSWETPKAEDKQQVFNIVIK